MLFKQNNLFKFIIKSVNFYEKISNVNTLASSSYKGSFHEWILKFFRTQPRYKKFLLDRDVDVTHLVKNLISLKAISTNELLINFSSLNTLPIINEVDRELESRVNTMNIDQMITLMDTCLASKNKLFKKSRAFKKCLETMDEKWFRKPDLNCYQTMQLIYYVSFFKKKATNVVTYGLKKIANDFNYLKKFSDEEMSILAITTYKTGAKVNDKLLRIIVSKLEKNLNNLIQTPILFVSLLKPLKKAKYHDPVLISKLIQTIKFDNNLVIKDVTSSIHFLSYLADANCGDIQYLQQLIDLIGNIMVQDNLKNYRIKDVTSFLFSISYLGLSVNNTSLKTTITNFLNYIFNSKENCIKHSKMFISINLSLWMLNWENIYLTKLIAMEIPISSLRSQDVHKQNYRLDLLLTCISIERPELIEKHSLNQTINTMPQFDRHLDERPFLQKVFKNLKELSRKHNLFSVEYNFCIPNIKILNIKVVDNNRIIFYFEVLDNTTCLHNTAVPHGMMKLKLRLESKLNYRIISINEINNILLSSKSLKQYLDFLLS
ncbi:uncharacterized protein LOC126895834 [Daktulosphaira vitifoliae]|uniref:uncharacterized protein LOC126895834 n=1 Tax=Daktulosphaira vitifoliae TaxID=58002 RepID=UPI0021AA6DFB|nr:uncharacterized protein LOC126895834 [Daktulosphaira vitifoliae]